MLAQPSPAALPWTYAREGARKGPPGCPAQFPRLARPPLKRGGEAEEGDACPARASCPAPTPEKSYEGSAGVPSPAAPYRLRIPVERGREGRVPAQPSSLSLPSCPRADKLGEDQGCPAQCPCPSLRLPRRRGRKGMPAQPSPAPLHWPYTREG